MRSSHSILLPLLMASALACSANQRVESVSRTSDAAKLQTGPVQDDPPKPSSAKLPAPTNADDVTVAVTNRDVLAALEERGFSLGQLLFGTDARTTAELDRVSGMRSVFDILRGDVRGVQRVHPLAKVTSMDGFRLFDERWLASKEMELALIGVFNRMDRRVFYPGSCGELRFVYRVGYRTVHAGAAQVGRLPMTMNAVFFLPSQGDCQAAARAWVTPKSIQGADLANWLTLEGPLSAERRANWQLKSLEVNLQSFRLQSFVHPTLAGHIDYVLRVFRANSPKREAFSPAPLENMVDVARLKQKPALRAELLSHLHKPEVLTAIDRGTLLLPEQFLATRAVSVSPRGLSRKANRPFRSLFSDQDFADISLTTHRTIASPQALLRRLDGSTCTGCHQSRSLAGFHHVGEDLTEHPVFDALFSGSSPHLTTDLQRRREYVAALATGSATDEFRPLPERQGTGSGFGAPCGLGDPGFAEWRCDAGLRCQRLEDEEIGVCLGEDTLGAPCQYGELVSASAPHRDRVTRLQLKACDAEQRCDINRSGFPLGACGGSCTSSLPDAACADFLDADAFQNCLRARKTFAQCAKQHVFGAGLRACDADSPCRQDYVCVRTRKPGVGACVPPYFVYQLRLDGYPLMR